MNVSDNDQAISDQLQSRDPNAVAAIYDRYASLVYSLFLRITHDHAIAEDLVQELFIRIWNRARDFDPQRGSLGIWIVSIARNMGIDHLRSGQARFAHRLQPIDAVHTLVEQQRDREAVIDESRAVRAAFALLSERQKLLVELAYFEGLSQTEIASRLGEPLGTVKSWMRSALQSLRASIKGSATV